MTSTDGFPSSGYVLIEDDKIIYTGKTDTTFTGCTSVEAHDDALAVKAYVVEISTTEPGGDISWDVFYGASGFMNLSAMITANKNMGAPPGGTTLWMYGTSSYLNLTN